MSLFKTILGKLGIGKDDSAGKAATGTAAGAVAKPAVTAKPAAAAAPPKPAAAAPTPKPAAATPTAKPVASAAASQPPASVPPPVTAAKPAAPTPIAEVDVVKQLEELSKGKGLNWKVSIVDLLKLLDMDSSFAARKELATELGCPADLMGDSAKMNVWLHKTVLKKIAENGGNIPKELLD